MAQQPVAGIYIELRALVAKFSKDMEGAVASVKQAESKMTRAFGAIDKVVKGALVIGAGLAVKQMITSIGDLADAGDELADLRESFQQLGGSMEQLKSAKDVLLGTVSNIDLMKIANEGLIRQIPDLSNNFGLLADYAGRFAESTGKDAQQTLEALVQSLGKAKAAQLSKLGVVIDNDKAYREYAASIGKSVDILTESEKVTARQTEAYDAIRAKIGELLPMGDSLNAAQQAINVAMREARAEFGMGIAANEDLQKAYRQLAAALDDIDWVTLGQEAARFFGMLAKVASAVIPPLVEEIRKAGFALRWMFSSDIEIQQKKITVTLGNLIKQQRELTDEINRKGETGDAFVTKRLFEQLDEVNKKIAEVRPEYERLTATLNMQTDRTNAAVDAAKKLREEMEASGSSAKGNKKTFEDLGATTKKFADEAKRAAENTANWKEKWKEFKQDQQLNDLNAQLDAAIEAVDSTTAEKLKALIAKAVRDGFVRSWKEAVDSGAVSMTEVEEQGKRAVTEVMDDYAEKQRQVAEEFKAQLADGADQIVGSLSRLGEILGADFSKIAEAFSTQLSEETKAKLGSGVQDVLKSIGVDMDLQELTQSLDGLATVLEAVASASDKNKKTQSERGTGEAVGAAAGAAGAAYFGIPPEIGAQIGKEIGGWIGGMFKWGPQSADAKARHAFANFVEEGFEKLGQVAFRDAAGRMARTVGDKFNFLEGESTRFNLPGWAEEMKKWDEASRSTFNGLGEGFKQLLGITEDVGGQIGFLLAENLNGNIDNARLLVAQLGVSFEDMQEKLMEAAIQGNMRWSEFEITIAGIANAFKPGIAAVGDLKGAMEQLIGSGGRGVAAIKSIKDIAVEAMEAGARTIEEMGQRMLQQGVHPQLVQDYLDALRQRGIKTLEELTNASDRVAGGIVAELESRNQAIRAQWQQMTEDLKGLQETIAAIPTEKDVKINVQTKFDENTRTLLNNKMVSGATTQLEAQRYAMGGVVDRPTFFSHGSGKLGVAGEAGAEAIMPLTRVGGKLGVLAAGNGGGKGITYIIDARGADMGVEQRIKSALRMVEDRAVQRSVNAMNDGYRRGARL